MITMRLCASIHATRPTIATKLITASAIRTFSPVCGVSDVKDAVSVVPAVIGSGVGVGGLGFSIGVNVVVFVVKSSCASFLMKYI